MRCDICRKPYSFIQLRKIEVDWNHQYKMVCPICVKERGAYMIACRTDKPKIAQDKEYQRIRKSGFE